MFRYLNLLLRVLVHFARADEFGLVRCPVGFKVLSVLPDVGPGPHAADASDVDVRDSAEGIMPPFKKQKPRQQTLESQTRDDV